MQIGRKPDAEQTETLPGAQQPHHAMLRTRSADGEARKPTHRSGQPSAQSPVARGPLHTKPSSCQWGWGARGLEGRVRREGPAPSRNVLSPSRPFRSRLPIADPLSPPRLRLSVPALPLRSTSTHTLIDTLPRRRLGAALLRAALQLLETCVQQPAAQPPPAAVLTAPRSHHHGRGRAPEQGLL